METWNINTETKQSHLEMIMSLLSFKHALCGGWDRDVRCFLCVIFCLFSFLLKGVVLEFGWWNGAPRIKEKGEKHVFFSHIIALYYICCIIQPLDLVWCGFTQGSTTSKLIQRYRCTQNYCLFWFPTVRRLYSNTWFLENRKLKQTPKTDLNRLLWIKSK